jgi:hypothetical protein
MPKHWHYEAKKEGACLFISKVNGGGQLLATFAEVFPFDDAETEASEMAAAANAWLDYQWSLTHQHDVEEFYDVVKVGAHPGGTPASSK